jgi:hypothetical protein
MIEIFVKAKVLFRPYRDEFSNVVFFLPTFHPQRDGTGLDSKKNPCLPWQKNPCLLCHPWQKIISDFRVIRGKKKIRDFPAPRISIADNPWQKKKHFTSINFSFRFSIDFLRFLHNSVWQIYWANYHFHLMQLYY